MDPQLAAILAIALLSGLVQGLAGFGSGLVAAPLLALFLPLETVVPLITLLSPLISFQVLFHLRHAIRFERVRGLLVGFALGTPLGLLLLTHAPAALLLGALGALLTGYALLSLAGRAVSPAHPGCGSGDSPWGWSPVPWGPPSAPAALRSSSTWPRTRNGGWIIRRRPSPSFSASPTSSP